jgi:dimethylaniline monooxygenase (N-oxide forming)
MSVAVLGAGPSGLVAAKEALENGLTPTVFEKEKELGGVWHPKTGAVWDRMRTNISKFTTVFGDTNYPEDTSELFPNSSSVQKYLNDYVDKFELRNYIQFHTEVVSVESDKNSGNSQGIKYIHSTFCSF